MLEWSCCLLPFLLLVSLPAAFPSSCLHFYNQMDLRDDDELEYPKPDAELDSPEVRPEFDYDPSVFYTDQAFEDDEELVKWAQTAGGNLGYILVRRRSNSNKAGTNKVTLVCNRSGKRDKRIEGPVKRSLKIGCPFRLEARLTSDYFWKVSVVDNRHNHHPAVNLEGHAYARRLSVDERDYVEKEIVRGTDPRHILKNLKGEFSGNLSRIKDIRNIKKSVQEKLAAEGGNTPMQVH